MTPLKRIFAFATDCHAPHKYYRLLWSRHIYDALRPHLDVLVTPDDLDFGWARQPGLSEADTQAARARTSTLLGDRITHAVREQGIEAVISYCFAADLELDLVVQTVRAGIPWINFYCDSTHMFERVEPLARLVSLNWFPEGAAEERYRRLGVPYLCAPYALNPEWLPDLGNQTPLHAAAFIGLPTSNRITRLGLLRLLGCRVDIRGHGWTGSGAQSPFYSAAPARRRLLSALFQPNLGEKILRRLLWPLVQPLARGPLEDEEFGGYVRQCLVLLGLNQGKDAQGRFVSYLKFRDVEFPGYGCCYLTEHNTDLARVFEVGKEVLTFASIPDAARQLRRLQAHPERAREIGRAGRARVLAEHNWSVRLRQLSERL